MLYPLSYERSDRSVYRPPSLVSRVSAGSDLRHVDDAAALRDPGADLGAAVTELEEEHDTYEHHRADQRANDHIAVDDQHERENRAQRHQHPPDHPHRAHRPSSPRPNGRREA